jgi:hypothetical protein
MKAFFKLISVTIISLLPLYGFAQLSLSDVITRTPTTDVPFYAERSTRTPRAYSFSVNNSDNAIPDKLYNDLQLLQFDHASISPELGARFYRKFSIPNNNNVLIAIGFGNGYGGSKTIVLCTVSPAFLVINSLEGLVMGDDLFIKQFRINNLHQIIVSTIKPTSTTTILFTNFSSFIGQRTDVTYLINSAGQFSKISEQKFQTKTYTRAELENTSTNIWNGGENPI